MHLAQPQASLKLNQRDVIWLTPLTPLIPKITTWHKLVWFASHCIWLTPLTPLIPCKIHNPAQIGVACISLCLVDPVDPLTHEPTARPAQFVWHVEAAA